MRDGTYTFYQMSRASMLVSAAMTFRTTCDVRKNYFVASVVGFEKLIQFFLHDFERLGRLVSIISYVWYGMVWYVCMYGKHNSIKLEFSQM